MCCVVFVDSMRRPSNVLDIDPITGKRYILELGCKHFVWVPESTDIHGSVNTIALIEIALEAVNCVWPRGPRGPRRQ